MKVNTHNLIYLEIANIIVNFVDEDSLEIYSRMGRPPKSDMGDFAYPLFDLAKKKKQNPVSLAKELESKIETNKIIQKVKAFGPYLNFFINTDYLANYLINAINDQSFFNIKTNTPLKVMIEYSQPNTHKQLHIGHMRNLSIGDAMSRIYRYMGMNVITATYPGDIGTHVAKSLWYLTKNKVEDSGNKGVWLGEIYTKASNSINEENKGEVSDVLMKLTKKEEPYYSLWQHTREWSINLMQDIYAWNNVTFDKWYFESEIDEESIKFAKELLEKGILVRSEGAIGADLSKDNLGFCILIKSDGTGTYAAKDIVLALKKFKEFNLDRSLYLVDDRQMLHFKQVFKILESIDKNIANSSFHLPYNLVELTTGAMSSRMGNTTPITTLTNNMVKIIIERFLSKKDWSILEIDDTAKKIATSAIKFGMLRIDSSRKIIFDMDAWLKLDGETGPYLQYAYARINSLVNKFDEGVFSTKGLNHPLEHQILIEISCFNMVVESAYLQNRPSLICSYLYDFAKLFNAYYAEVPIGNVEKDIKSARICLIRSVSSIIKQGLDLLGIETVSKM